MKIMIFDTETTSLNKPFCYNVGYVIADTDTKEIVETKDFVAEQIWHNLALFSTAYYAEKRQLYVKDMRSRKTRMMKFGRICQEMIRDIKKYNIQMAFAYNSDFDERVFDFNCDWFKCINPFDTVEIKVKSFVKKITSSVIREIIRQPQNVCIDLLQIIPILSKTIPHFPIVQLNGKYSITLFFLARTLTRIIKHLEAFQGKSKRH